MEIDARIYHLPTRTKLIQLSDTRIGISMIRKRRIIQKDAFKIIEIATAIRQIDPQLEISLVCTHNICSKSIVLLHCNAIDIDFL